MVVPSVVMALRTLLAVEASVSAVEVSTLPLDTFTIPTTRLTVEAAAVEGVAPPGATPYPVNEMYCSFGEMVNNPSEVELPWAVNANCEPTVLVGISIDPTRTPASVYSSNQTSVAAVVPATSPASPTRYRTKSPAVNGRAPCAC